MQRRRYLRAVGVGAGAGLAGCLGVGDANPDVALAEPDGRTAGADLPYPTWGERMPDVSLPAPVAGGERNLRDLGRPSLVTFFFSNCETVCPVLIGALRNVQTHAIEEGYADAVGFAPVTFDPERDDAERLRAYADGMNVSLTAGGSGWTFLRPGSVDRAKAVVNGEFGVGFERQPTDGEGYMFQHLGLVLLVNADGYVERAYQSNAPDPRTMIEDLRKLR